MKRIGCLAALALLGAAPLSQADVGPAPTWRQATTLGEQAIRATLIDPQSAQIEWPYNFVGGTLGHRRAGYWTCGRVNAKNRMGGYAGPAWFLVMIHDGAVSEMEVGSPDGVDGATPTCLSALKRGLLAPAPQSPPLATTRPQKLMDAADASAAAAARKGGLGISFLPSPVGAVILAVAPGSLAEKSGLKPGETIESVDAMSVKDMATADMIKAISAPTVATLGIAGVGTVRVR